MRENKEKLSRNRTVEGGCLEENLSKYQLELTNEKAVSILKKNLDSAAFSSQYPLFFVSPVVSKRHALGPLFFYHCLCEILL